MHKTRLLDIDLRLFDGAAGGAAAAGAAAPAGEGTAAQAGAGAEPKAETRQRGSSRRARSGEFDNVVFGKQEDAPGAAAATPSVAGENQDQGGSKSGVSTTSDTLEAKRAAFKELIEGEYKDQYTEMFQQAFNRRFKETKGMEKTLSEQKAVLDIMMQKYGIADGDMKKLQSAVEEDATMWEEAAEKAGLSVEQYKAMQKLERENAELRALRQKQQGEQQAQQRLNQWYAEAEKVRQMYPSFDFRKELADRDFQGLLRAGVPVQKAYELKHMDEIKEATARTAAQNAGEQMKARIQQKAARPTENGTSSQSAVIVKNDVHNLTRKERAEIARRVQRGEQIKF